MKKREELDKLREMAEDELAAEAARLRESLFRLNFKGPPSIKALRLPRARETRLFIVPLATPQILAAASYSRPETPTRSRALR